jgi:hypothetical protein
MQATYADLQTLDLAANAPLARFLAFGGPPGRIADRVNCPYSDRRQGSMTGREASRREALPLPLNNA